MELLSSVLFLGYGQLTSLTQHKHMFLYLIALGWIYVALLAAIAEATASNGSVLGAIVTFIFYGLLPLSLVLYLIGTPMRKRSRKKMEQDKQDPKQD